MIKDYLQATAALAHLDLDADELAAALPAFEQMLGYFAAMLAADADGAAFAGSVADPAQTASGVAINHFRSELNYNNNPLVNANLPADVLLAQSGETDGRFIVVPNVL